MNRTLAALAFALLCSSAAFADTVPAPPTADWAADETVTVMAQRPGPAFWHIKKGDSEIWILGTVSPMPRGLVWSSAHVAEVIKGARVVLTAPKASSGLFSTGWFLLTHRGLLSMPDGQNLEDSLPADLRARFVAAREGLKLKADKFSDDPPVVAALELQQRFNQAHQLETSDPWNTVARLADEADVPVRSIGDYEAVGIVKEMLRLPPERQQQCLAEAVAYTEQQSAHNAALSQDWAVGNLAGIKAHYVPAAFGDCVKQSATFGKFMNRAVADYLRAIHEALSKPGKVVMLVDIGHLLRSTGVAEALHQEGVTIEGPAE